MPVLDEEFTGTLAVVVNLNDDLTYSTTLTCDDPVRGDPFAVLATAPTRGKSLAQAFALARHQVLQRTKGDDEP